MRRMFIRLDIAIRDIMGKTGRNIIQAILEGERDPVRLAALTDVRVKKSPEEIARSLEGQWKDEQLFVLEECFTMYNP